MSITINSSPKPLVVELLAPAGENAPKPVNHANSKAVMHDNGALQITGDEEAGYPAGTWASVRTDTTAAASRVKEDDGAVEALLTELFDVAVSLANADRNRGFGPAAQVLEVATRIQRYLAGAA